MKIVTVAEMVAMEQATAASGFGYDRMMAAAGGALAAVVAEQAPADGLILALIGPGNNGGDGLVACARLQAAGRRVVPYIWRRKEAADPLVAAVREPLWADADPGHERLQALTVEAAVIVDALLGTGNVRPIGGSLAALLEAVHAALRRRRTSWPGRVDPTRPQPPDRPLIVACDCPSGLNCDTGAIDPLALPADLTVTFALPKVGHFLAPGAAFCGRLIVAAIGIDRGLAPDTAPDLLTGVELAEWLPPRSPLAHKGTFGRALIVAGSGRFPGAAAIACEAAYAAGAGLVHLAAIPPVGHIVAARLAEPVHTALPGTPPEAPIALAPAAVSVLAGLLADHDALLIGPGLSTHPETMAFVRAVLIERPAVLPPLVVDADALNALAGLGLSPAALPPLSILTPHPGEMARLTGLSTKAINAERWAVARRFAGLWQQIVVLKGAHTVIAHPDGRLAISPFAEAALATAGSGDVLAGILVALLAQGLEPWTAARLGVYLHALAGGLAAQTRGPTLLAGDIARHVPQALARWR
jgi:NAD(P)H-hydrate epimerase